MSDLLYITLAASHHDQPRIASFRVGEVVLDFNEAGDLMGVEVLDPPAHLRDFLTRRADSRYHWKGQLKLQRKTKKLVPRGRRVRIEPPEDEKKPTPRARTRKRPRPPSS